jgi:hypothetical protein
MRSWKVVLKIREGQSKGGAIDRDCMYRRWHDWHRRGVARPELTTTLLDAGVGLQVGGKLIDNRLGSKIGFSSDGVCPLFARSADAIGVFGVRKTGGSAARKV